MFWLLNETVAEELRKLRASGLEFTASQRDEFVARMSSETTALGGAPRNLRVAGDVAEIRVEGILTEKPDFFARFFGGGNTTYESIRSSLALVEADPAIKRVQFNVNSPGGEVSGLFDTLAAIEAFSKPTSVVAAAAESAAFAIAAAGGKIEATNPAAPFGSVGVATRFVHLEEIIDITSTEAPDKRPDPTTAEGQAVIRRHLDDLHKLFATAIARGRGTTLADVNENFGRGATLLASDARRQGMIDKIAKPALRAVNVAQLEDSDDASARVGDLVAVSEPSTESPESRGDHNPGSVTGGAQHQEEIMNKKELKENHPEVFAAVIAEGKAQGATDEAAAVAAGLETERDRVNAHLVAGEASGDMKTALAAVKDGTAMSETLRTQYMMAAANRSDRGTRQTETDEAAGATTAIETPAEGPKDAIDETADAMDRLYPVTSKKGD